jgi:hypothetical protein
MQIIRRGEPACSAADARLDDPRLDNPRGKDSNAGSATQTPAALKNDLRSLLINDMFRLQQK